ncbi:phage protein NinX family protein [Enterobacter quasiroggenkampii]|uniref:phage protein NinX family protein n=1 Tax=Enterobacter quasiroggenkampii TaxID=2497436 RepID=UPI0039C21D19
MDYSQLSDLEINQRVSNAIPGRFIFYPDYVWDSEWEKTFDPCNKASDAWPIIQANGICIGYDGISWDASCHLHDIGQVNDWKNHPEKPLRMAMIVFLLIQDANHA